MYIGDVASKRGEKTPTILLECSLLNNNKFTKIKSVPNIGAEATICGPALMKKLKIRKSDIKKNSENESLIEANGLPIKTIRKLRLQIRADEYLIEDVIICEDQNELLLSWTACRDLHIIPPDFPRPLNCRKVEKEISQKRKYKAEMLENFSNVFSPTEGLPTMKGEAMKMHSKEGATPSAIYTCRQIPFK